MGSSWLQTVYYLSAGDDQKLAGRLCLDQYATLLGHFVGSLTLRNATCEEAKMFSGVGRPFNVQDLEFLISRGSAIAPDIN
jgi:hypothetical protein